MVSINTPKRVSNSTSSSFHNTPFKKDLLDSPSLRSSSSSPSISKKTPKRDRDLSRRDRFIPSTHAETITSLHSTSELSNACGLHQRILTFAPSAPVSKKSISLVSQYAKPVQKVQVQRKRKINSTPERVLDAPGLLDDYYLNLLDWSVQNNVAIALDKSIYIWSAESGQVSSLYEAPESTYISSLSFSNDGAYLGVGLGTGHLQIHDVNTATLLRTMTGHEARIASQSWNGHLLSSGSRTGAIFNSDVRQQSHKISELLAHESEVCGLAWRSDGAQLASGGNDNLVNIFDARSTVPKITKSNHKAAVKALSWAPWQLNLLATGGGSNDRNIHFWNTTTGSRLASIDTGSQVTSLRFSQHHKEVVSSHGYPDNQLSVYSYPSCEKIASVQAHESRILHSSLSPDGQVLATVASDENLKFWRIWDSSKSKMSQNANNAKGMEKGMMIR